MNCLGGFETSGINNQFSIMQQNSKVTLKPNAIQHVALLLYMVTKYNRVSSSIMVS